MLQLKNIKTTLMFNFWRVKICFASSIMKKKWLYEFGANIRLLKILISIIVCSLHNTPGDILDFIITAIFLMIKPPTLSKKLLVATDIKGALIYKQPFHSMLFCTLERLPQIGKKPLTAVPRIMCKLQLKKIKP